MGILSFLFKPDMEPINKMGMLMAAQRYMECAAYIKSVDPKKFSKCINYQLGVKKHQGERGMHAYKILVELFYLKFHKQARRYDPEYYKLCSEKESENDRPLCYEVQQMAQYFADEPEWKKDND